MKIESIIIVGQISRIAVFLLLLRFFTFSTKEIPVQNFLDIVVISFVWKNNDSI